MTTDRWQQLKDIFNDALERPPAERAAFLDAACAGDAELRREAESLLAEHAAPAATLDSLPGAIAAQMAQATTQATLTGQMIGLYRVGKLLGAGGMGEVYRADDTRLGRTVALKLLRTHLTADPAARARFKREAKAVAVLAHPNVVTLHDYGEADGVFYAVTELLDGQTLRAALNGGALPWRRAVEIAADVAAGLAATHAKGIIHCDLKPENIFLTRDGYVKILDFGIARIKPALRQDSLVTAASDASGFRTEPGVIIGTVRYMSPEQALGQELDQRTDLFSLGVVLYEMLAGAPPFKGTTPAALFDAIVHHPPMPLTQIQADLPPELARLTAQLLEKERVLRRQTAADVRAELKQLQRESDSGNNAAFAVPPPPLAAPSRWRWGLVAAACAVLALLALAVWRRWPAPPSPWLNAYASHLTTMRGEEYNPSLTPDGKHFYYARQTQGQWDIYFQRVGGGNPLLVTPDSSADDRQPVCAPDGNRFVFRSERQGGGLFVADATGESVRLVARQGQQPAWSPDGTQLVYATDYIVDPRRRAGASQLWIVDLATGAQRQLPLPPGGDAAQPHWSPHNRRLAFYFRTGQGPSDICTMTPAGADFRCVTSDAAIDWNPVWSGDGKYLYFASDRKSLASVWRVAVDEDTGQARGVPEAVTGQAAEAMQLDVARDGRSLIYVTREQFANIRVIGFDPARLTTVGEPVWVTQGSRPAGSPDVAPDGQRIAFHSLGAPREDIYVTRSDGQGAPSNLLDDDFLDRAPRWAPDGQRLAFHSTRTGSSQIWLINADGGGLRQLTQCVPGCQTPSWSPDGRWLAYNLLNQGGLQMIEAARPWAEQTPRSLVTAQGGRFSGSAWSPDGQWLAGSVNELRDGQWQTQPGIWLYSLAAQRYERLTEGGARPAWLPDGRHLLFWWRQPGKLADTQMWVVDRTAKQPQPLLTDTQYSLSSFALSADGRKLFLTSVAHQADIFRLSLEK